MLNILIPTDFTESTINAIHTAKKLVKGKTCRIVLLNIIPLPDSITDMLFLPRYGGDKCGRVMDEFQQKIDKLKESNQDVISNIEIHCQYGMSSHLMEQILSIYSIDFSIVSICDNMKTDATKKELIRTLKTRKTPLLLLPDSCKLQPEMNIGLVLEESATAAPEKLGVLYDVIQQENAYIIRQGGNKIHFNDRVMPKDRISTILEEYQISLLVHVKQQRSWKSFFAPRQKPAFEPVHLQVPVLSV